MTQETLKLALEFIENSECGTADLEARIKEALAQTQEPKIGCVNHDCDKCKAQRTWVGLTDKELMDMYNEPRSDAEMIAFGREVEAKLKELNT